MIRIRKAYAQSDEYKYPITLYDQNGNEIRSEKCHYPSRVELVLHEAQAMLADHMELNIGGKVEIRGPGGLIIFFQNPRDFEPTETRHNRSVDFSEFG